MAHRLRVKAAKDGIEVLALDWTGDPPLLATVLAKADAHVIGTIEALSPGAEASELKDLFAAIRHREGFKAQTEKILRRLHAAETATIRAVGSNREWFAKRFKNSRLARLDLRQPLAPNDHEVLLAERADLVSSAIAPLTRQQPVVLLGDEGCGKSWLAATVIERQEANILTALFTADQLPESVAPGQTARLLAQQLIRQTDGDPDEARLLTRWCRRIDAWIQNRLVHHPHGASNDTSALRSMDSSTDTDTDRVRLGRFLIVLDGLNQRPEKDWARTIDAFQQLAEKGGGRLLVTCRNHYFTTRLKGRLSQPLQEITVPEWTPGERDVLLTRAGVDPTILDPQAASSLLNPRLLGIALKVLPRNDHAWQGLTVERLLFEHIRAGKGTIRPAILRRIS